LRLPALLANRLGGGLLEATGLQAGQAAANANKIFIPLYEPQAHVVFLNNLLDKKINTLPVYFQNQN